MTAAIVVGVVVIVLFLGGCALLFEYRVVREHERVVIERNGRFHRVLTPGGHFLNRLVDKVAGTVDMRVVQSAPVTVRVKTSDFVFVDVSASYLCQVDPERVYEAFYRYASGGTGQSRSHRTRGSPFEILDGALVGVCQAAVERLSFLGFYEHQELVCDRIRQVLANLAQPFGRRVPSVFLALLASDDIAGMTMGVEADLRTAPKANEVYRVRTLGKAFTDMEAMILQGRGEAGRLKAILISMADVADELQRREGWTSADVDRFTIFVQRVIALVPNGASTKTSVLFTPDIAEAFGSLRDLFRKRE